MTRIEGRIVERRARRRERRRRRACGSTGERTRRGRSVHRLLGLSRAADRARRSARGTRTGRTGCRATARWRCRARMRGDAHALHPRDRARGGLAVAHPAPAPHRQRLCLFAARIMSRRRGRARPCSPTSTARRWPIRGRCASPRASARSSGTRNCRRARAGGRLPGAARIDQHPPGPVGDRAACSNCCPAARSADADGAPNINRQSTIRMRAHPRLPGPALSSPTSARRAVLAITAATMRAARRRSPHKIAPVPRDRAASSARRTNCSPRRLAAGDARPGDHARAATTRSPTHARRADLADFLDAIASVAPIEVGGACPRTPISSRRHCAAPRRSMTA